MKCLYCGEEIVIGEHSGHWWNSCQACGFGWDFTDEGGVMEMNYLLIF